MNWPTNPTCHGDAPRFSRDGVTWRPPRVENPPHDFPGDAPFRTCSYCGSIHPEDLALALESGATLGGSDWKYGWPHKFYVNGIPSGLLGQRVVVGTGPGKGDVEYGERKTAFAKWYNEHLTDAGLDDEAFARLTALLDKHAGIEFSRTRDPEGRLTYAAPSAGYQR